MTVFTHQLRVRYAECDQQGVVFNGHYLFFYDVAFNELWRAHVGAYQETVARGFDLVVAEATIRYRAPARFDELLDISLIVTHLGSTSLVVQPKFRVGHKLIADGEIRHVFVDTATLTRKPMPDDIRAALAGAT